MFNFFLSCFSSFFLSFGCGSAVVSSVFEARHVEYILDDSMIKSVDYHSWEGWVSVPWTTSYFDINQLDIKLNSFKFAIGDDNPYKNWLLNIVSDTAGVPSLKEYVPNNEWIDLADKSWSGHDGLYWVSRILFAKNFVPTGKRNFVHLENYYSILNYLDVSFSFEISKPLSFYINSFLMYFYVLNREGGSSMATYSVSVSFLDFLGETWYDLKQQDLGVGGSADSYKFVTMPIQVPNLKEIKVDIRFADTKKGDFAVDFGQFNIFSKEDIVPIPPASPFSEEYERVAWYNVFGHLRNAFRWAMYGVIGSILPVDDVRKFFLGIDVLLRNMFNDTFSMVFGSQNVSILGTGLTIFVFWKGVRFVGG